MRTVSRKARGAHVSLTWADFPHDVVEKKGRAQLLEDFGKGAFGDHVIESQSAVSVSGVPATLYTLRR